MKKTKKRTVSFRVEDEEWELLEMKAKEYDMTVHAYAHYSCKQSILGESYLLQEIMERQEEIREGQEMQETNLKTATVALLVDAGKASVPEAQAFVREKFRKRRSQTGGDEDSCPKNGARG
jgi:hypothetical protein